MPGKQRRGPILRSGVLLLLCLWAVPACTLKDFAPLPVVMTNLTQVQPLAGEDRLIVRIRFPAGHVLVDAAPAGSLFALDVDYDSGTFRHDFHYDPATRRLDFKLAAKSGSQGGSGGFDLNFDRDEARMKNRLHLRLSAQVPLELDLSSGLGESKINLTGLQVSSLELNSGVSTTFLTKDLPNPVVCSPFRIRSGVGKLEALRLGNFNFRTMEYQGGVGESLLDFTGEWRQNAEIQMTLGIGDLRVTLPPEVGAEVDAHKKLLSGLHLESFAQRGDRYFSNNYDKAPVHLGFRIQTGIGSVRIKWL